MTIPMWLRKTIERVQTWTRCLWWPWSFLTGTLLTALLEYHKPSTEESIVEEPIPPSDSVPDANSDGKASENPINHGLDTELKNDSSVEEAKPKIPRNIGSRRDRETTTSNSKSEQQQSSTPRPELVCRESSSTWMWEIILSAEDECQVASVRHNGKSLHEENNDYRIPSFGGSLTVAYKNGKEDRIPLFEKRPLIFKLSKNWTGDGRKVKSLTRGDFIVIVPNQWERLCHPPVTPRGCIDESYKAHYFSRDKDSSENNIIGFKECKIASEEPGFELLGEHVADDFEGGGLFVGNIPDLKLPSNVDYVRVGEEKKDGWRGKNFKPNCQTLSSILGNRQGRFFIRVYSEGKLLDSGEFRYLRDLKEILVNGERYTEQKYLIPPSFGYSQTTVRFIGSGGAIVRQIVSPGIPHVEEKLSRLVIEPHPKNDQISCTLKIDSDCVDIALRLPRIWWRVKRNENELSEWRDTPIIMTRSEFREHAYADSALHLRFPKSVKLIHLGFDNELGCKYDIAKNNEIPFGDFVDYSQISQPLRKSVALNVKFDEATFPLVQIPADPVPKIISFTCNPEEVNAGERAVLHWETQDVDAEDVVIDPEIGKVGLSGNLEVVLHETTTYTLRLISPDIDDVIKAVTVAVGSQVQPGKKYFAHVRRAVGGWRYGKGFSYGELQKAGLTVDDARHISIPIDKRRRSVHHINVETIGGAGYA